MSEGKADAQSADGAGAPPPQPSRQYVQFIFYKVDPAFRMLPPDDREAAKREAVAAVEASGADMQVRCYTLTGIRGDADFMLWHIADDLAPFQQAATRLLGTKLGPYLSTPYAYLAMTRKSVYVDKGEPSAASRRLRLSPGTAKYLFVYPFVKTRAWYALPQEQRQAMMDVHIRIGRKYPSVKLNTTYSFGLDDQEFVVAFETDEPGDFLDLVMELRETESSLYTLRDTPTFTCVATTVRGALDALDGTAATVAPDAARDDTWKKVCDADALPTGQRTAVYFEGEQVALFNIGGELHAIEARCPHASAPLVEGTLEGSQLTCPYHGSRFDLADGAAVVGGPAARPPRVYAAKVSDGSIMLSASEPRAAGAPPVRTGL